MKIGLFFGSFNPVHVGHLIIAQSAVNETDLDKVWMVVSPQNPFKKKANLLGEYDRFRMVELALEGNPKIQASNVEFMLEKPSFTIDTLIHLREKYPSYEFCILMGEDNLEHFHKWKNYEAILNYYPIYVYPRPGSPAGLFEKYPTVVPFNLPLLDISATRVRELISEGKSARYVVHDEVLDYIEKNNLYGN